LVHSPSLLLIFNFAAGKSSLLNTLSPSLQLAVNDLSRKSQGRHTTTQTILHTLEGGGEIIDSPGFQNYQPPPSADVNVFQDADYVCSCCFFCRSCHYGSRCLHVSEPLCAVRLCLRPIHVPGILKEFTPAPLPDPATSLSTDATDAPHTVEAMKAAKGDVPEALSPEAHFFTQFQQERARLLEQGISDVDDASIGSGLALSHDAAETALRESKNKSLDSKGRKKAWDALHRRETTREIDQIVEQNEALKRQVEQQAFERVDSHSAAPASTADDASLSPHDASLAARRSLELTKLLAQKGLLDSVSTRRYQSYLQLVQQQREIEKKKYEK
jgi:hypothetical protein